MLPRGIFGSLSPGTLASGVPPFNAVSLRPLTRLTYMHSQTQMYFHTHARALDFEPRKMAEQRQQRADLGVTITAVFRIWRVCFASSACVGAVALLQPLPTMADSTQPHPPGAITGGGEQSAGMQGAIAGGLGGEERSQPLHSARIRPALAGRFRRRRLPRRVRDRRVPTIAAFSLGPAGQSDVQLV